MARGAYSTCAPAQLDDAYEALLKAQAQYEAERVYYRDGCGYLTGEKEPTPHRPLARRIRATSGILCYPLLSGIGAASARLSDFRAAGARRRPRPNNDGVRSENAPSATRTEDAWHIVSE